MKSFSYLDGVYSLILFHVLCSALSFFSLQFSENPPNVDFFATKTATQSALIVSLHSMRTDNNQKKGRPAYTISPFIKQAHCSPSGGHEITVGRSDVLHLVPL